MDNICDRSCAECYFSCRYSRRGDILCTYYLKTGQRRPCGAGLGCSVKRISRKPNTWRQMSDEQWKQYEPVRKKAEAPGGNP